MDAVIKLTQTVSLPGRALCLAGEVVSVPQAEADDLVARGLAATHVASLDAPPTNKMVQQPSTKKGRA